MKFRDFLNQENLNEQMQISSETDLMVQLKQFEDEDILYSEYIEIASGYVLAIFDELHEIVRMKYQKKLLQVQNGRKKLVDPLSTYEKNDEILRDFLSVFLQNIHTYKRDFADKQANKIEGHRESILGLLKENQKDLIKLVRKVGIKI